MDVPAARRNMIESQVRAFGIEDPELLKAMARIGRESFLSKAMRHYANIDADLDIGQGRFMLAPLTLARLLKAAAIRPTDVVLCIGDATGYATAVMACLAQTVVSLECEPDKVKRSTQALADLGIDNAAMITGPLAKGLAGQAPFDVIVFAGATGTIPKPIQKQLADGGRLAAVVGPGGGTALLTRIVRVGDCFSTEVLGIAAAAPLPGLAHAPSFVF